MKRLLLFCLLGVLALDPNPADAQHKMPAKAAKEIIFQTNQLVMQYEQLLQTIALSGSFPSEIKTIIEESYGPTKNRIFASKEVIIEDDINPRFTSGNNTTDMAVDKYLSNLDIYYVKTDDPTIFLTEKVISSVKHKTFPYVDVAYTAVYKSKNRQDTLEYQRVRRVLTVRADEVDASHWHPTIVAIRFAKNSDTTQPNMNDVALEYAPGDDKNATASSVDVFNTVMQEEARKDYAETKVKRERAYNHEVTMGDSLADIGIYDLAIQYYNRAVDINPYNFQARAKAKEAEREMTRRKELDQKQGVELVAIAEEGQRVKDYAMAKQSLELLQRRTPTDEDLKKRLIAVESAYNYLLNLESQVKGKEVDDAVKIYTKEINKAMKEKNNALSADLLAARTRVFTLAKDYKSAKKDVLKALELLPSHRPALVAQAKLQMAQGLTMEAVQTYTQIIADSKFSSHFYTERSKVWLARRDTTKAFDDMEQAIGLSPEDPNLYSERAALLAQMKRYPKALPDLSRAITLSPDNGRLYYQRGMCYVGMNDVEQAVKDFNRCKKLGMGEQERNSVRGVATGYYTGAKTKFAAGLPGEALTLSTDAVRLYPELAEALLLKGQVYYNIRNYDRAIETFTHAIDVRAGYTDALLARAEAYMAKKKYEEAIADCEAVTKLMPTYAPGYLMLGRTNQAQGSNTQAEAAYKKALEISGSDPDVHLAFGQFWMTGGDYRKASKAYSMAVRNSRGQHGEAYAYMAHNAMLMGEKGDALSFANNSLKNGTEHPLAYLVKARSLLNQKKAAEAAPLLESALAHDPYQQWPDISIALSQTYCQTGSYRKGLFVLGKLNPVHRRSAEYLSQAGDCHLMLNDLDSASSFYESALMVKPTFTQSLVGLACVEIKRNDLDKAIRYMEKALKTKTLTEDEIKEDARLKTLVADKRFKTMMKQYL